MVFRQKILVQSLQEVPTLVLCFLLWFTTSQIFSPKWESDSVSSRTVLISNNQWPASEINHQQFYIVLQQGLSISMVHGNWISCLQKLIDRKYIVIVYYTQASQPHKTRQPNFINKKPILTSNCCKKGSSYSKRERKYLTFKNLLKKTWKM